MQNTVNKPLTVKELKAEIRRADPQTALRLKAAAYDVLIATLAPHPWLARRVNSITLPEVCRRLTTVLMADTNMPDASAVKTPPVNQARREADADNKNTPSKPIALPFSVAALDAQIRMSRGPHQKRLQLLRSEWANIIHATDVIPDKTGITLMLIDDSDAMGRELSRKLGPGAGNRVMGFHTETMQGWGRIWPENVQTFIGGLTNAELGIIVVADGGMTAISFDPPTTSDSILAAPQAQA